MVYGGPSGAQILVRQAFKKCCNCFGAQPQEGPDDPPEYGPRGRNWWYDNAGAMWYYNNFIRVSWQRFFDGGIPDWCRSGPLNISPWFYVNQYFHDTIFYGTNFAQSGCYYYFFTDSYYACRNFASIYIGGLMPEDAERSQAIHMVFSYKQSYEGPHSGAPLFFEHPVYWVDYYEQLVPFDWDHQKWGATEIGSFKVYQNRAGPPLLGDLTITGKYKWLIENEIPYLNITFRSPHEASWTYPWSAISFFKDEIAGEGFPPFSFLAYY